MNAEERAKNLIVSIENDSTDEVVNRIAQALRDAERDALERNAEDSKIAEAAMKMVRRSIVDHVGDASPDGWHVELFTDKDAWEQFFNSIPKGRLEAKQVDAILALKDVP